MSQSRTENIELQKISSSEILHRRDDGTFVIQRGGHPYHVTEDDPLYKTVVEVAGDNEYPAESPPAAIVLPSAKSVTLAQARVALLQAGLLDDVRICIDAANNPALNIAWEYANTVDRDGVFVTMLKSELGLTEQQVDELFEAAAAIKF